MDCRDIVVLQIITPLLLFSLNTTLYHQADQYLINHRKYMKQM